ncbi:cell wall-associated NlpC family hydrolase [Pseudoclavibacter chungangensis]|nr:NlpC/P60 family protein [Pseudoclavibacter chungangensis]NYJ65738.1 cell wall-associated NlpC family hydrolase [Pseudoclavibacter chungangensis]
MTNISSMLEAPLTRREAREIERRTGRRPVAGGVAPTEVTFTGVRGDIDDRTRIDDTSRIERADIAGLVSVVPTAVLERIGSPVDETQVTDAPAAFARSTATVRAPRPYAVVRRERRRKAAGIAVAASAAALATVGAVVPVQLAAGADEASQASLLSAAQQAQQEAAQQSAPVDEAAPPQVDLVEAPVEAAGADAYSVTSLTAGDVAEIVPPEPVADEPAEDTASEGTSGGTAADESTGASQGGGESTPGNGYGQGIIATAESMLGGGQGWLCTDFVSAVLTANGIPHAQGTVSTMAASGTPVSDPQPGDLIVFSSGHIGIYAGGGMMYDNPGFNSSYVGWQNVYRSIDVIDGSYSFVRMG